MLENETSPSFWWKPVTRVISWLVGTHSSFEDLNQSVRMLPSNVTIFLLYKKLNVDVDRF